MFPTKKESFLHLSLSTRRPAQSVERAVFTDSTRILPMASLQKQNNKHIITLKQLQTAKSKSLNPLVTNLACIFQKFKNLVKHFLS